MKSIILDKFIDSKNHGEKTIIYGGKNTTEKSMIFPGNLEDMYDFVDVGDSIIKIEN